MTPGGARTPVAMPWHRWFTADWLTDELLSACSPATRGVWMDWLCVMIRSQTYSLTGTAEQLARRARCEPSDAQRAVADLQSSNAACVRRNGEIITVVSRRLLREFEAKKANKKRQKRFREKPKPSGVTLLSQRPNAVDTESDTEKTPPLPPATGGDPPGFVRFWDSWPPHRRKVNRVGCLKLWVKGQLEPQADAICAGLERWKSSPDWTKDGGEYIPMVATWLRQARWGAEHAAPADEWRRVPTAQDLAELRAERAQNPGLYGSAP